MGEFLSKNCCSDNSNLVTFENVSSLMNSYIHPGPHLLNFENNDIVSDLRPLHKFELDLLNVSKSSMDMNETPKSGERSRKSFKRSSSNKSRNSFLKKAKKKLYSPIGTNTKAFNFKLTFSAACSLYDGNYNNYIDKPAGDMDYEYQEDSIIIEAS